MNGIDDLIGRELGGYRIDALLGEGNMGAVYQGYDVALARKVVLKVMHRQLASHESFQNRFMQEAQAAARLDHPSIVKLYSFGDQPYLHMVMEYVEGPSLGEYLKHQQNKNKVVNLDTVLRLVAQVADALDYAHGRGVIHRDIKPSNVLLKPLARPDRDGDPELRAVVSDFGLAKLLEGGMHTLTGTFMGTLSYMSPEQCLGRDLDGRSDLYSLGIVLYQVTTGQLPFNVKSPTDAIRMHVKEIPPAPRMIRPGLPESVEAIILKAIAKNPTSRYQTGSQLADALRRVAYSLSNPGEPAELYSENDATGYTVVAPDAVDQLLIYHAGEAPRVMHLSRDKMVVGRGQENEITLPDKGVSRHHVRIERDGDGWRVVDLASTNGSFIDKMRLAPESTESWPQGIELRIGPYSLQWQKAVPVAAQDVNYNQPIPLSDIEDGPSQTSPGEIEIVVDPAATAIMAGDHVNIQVMLINRGPIVEHVSLRAEKLPHEWVSYSQDLLKLMPGGRGFIRMTVQPPRNHTASSGTHPFQIVATPMSNPEALVAASCQMNIEAFSEYNVYLNPKPLRNIGRAEIQVVNEGNAQSTYVISGVESPDGAVQFNPETLKVRAHPGEQQTGEIEVSAIKRPLMGATKRVPYEIEIWSKGGGTKRVRSELEIRPKLPAWLILMLAAVTVAIIVFTILWLTIPR